MQFHRFMTADEFVRELDLLRVYGPGEASTGLLEMLEEASLLYPRLRVHYPDPVARRMWLEAHEHIPCQMKQAVEADGPCWDAAAELDDAIYRWRNYIVYDLFPNPLDDPKKRFYDFIQKPQDFTFKRRRDRCVDVSNDVYDELIDDLNFYDFYSTWQILIAAEIADFGLKVRINLIDSDVSQILKDAQFEGRIPSGFPISFDIRPFKAVRDFAQHENALDAVVWFAEERWRILSKINYDQGGKRFRLSREQNEQYKLASRELASEAVRRFGPRNEDLFNLVRFLANYWSHWTREGRPKIADAYKAFIARATDMIMIAEDIPFTVLRDRIGRIDGWFKPIFDVIWPDWESEEKERTRLTLISNIKSREILDFPVFDKDIDNFIKFISNSGLETFFWRLKSFETHYLHGSIFSIDGMKSDIQGMSVVVEHISISLGCNKGQLYENFKHLWRGSDVGTIIRRQRSGELARRPNQTDWSALKGEIRGLCSEPGGQIAADLIMAHRIRGGVHSPLPESDPFELAELFLGLMRAALMTFLRVERVKSLTSEQENSDG